MQVSPEYISEDKYGYACVCELTEVRTAVTSGSLLISGPVLYSRAFEIEEQGALMSRLSYKFSGTKILIW